MRTLLLWLLTLPVCALAKQPAIIISDAPFHESMRREHILVSPTHNTTLAEMMQAIAEANPQALRAGFIVSPEVANLRGFGFYYNGPIPALWKSLSAYFSQGGASGACLDVDFTGFLVFRACPRGSPNLNNVPPRGLRTPATQGAAGGQDLPPSPEVVR